MSTKTTLATAACFDAKRHPHCRCGTTLDYATRSDRLVDHHRYREVGLQEVISAPDIDCGRMTGKPRVINHVLPFGRNFRESLVRYCLFGWLHGSRKLLKETQFWLRRLDLN
jgi:hypothetical protein